MWRRRSIFDRIREYLDEFERATEEAFSVFEQPSWDVESKCLRPLFNISVTSREVVVTADLPYADPKTLRIESLDDQIEITAKMKVKLRFEDFGVSHRQGEFSSFHCRIPLPVPVDASRARASFKKGILEVRLPRRRGYRIRVE
ncbi:TPA: Hsp20/alpha crystallin family protein [Candidatus Bathyarchaeota archaeon]|nr:Hsp20/alpha crystallin family protein [Candidatus Bathyarchaeota archaeon]